MSSYFDYPTDDAPDSDLTFLADRAEASPFRDVHFSADEMKEIKWIKPKLVAQIGFTEWTAGGKLRHPRFLGLREDKRPEEVVREG